MLLISMQTLLHEAIHANLFATVIKLNNGTVPADTGFEALYENYRGKKGWQHEFMADHYTGLMQEALKDVHQNLDDQNFIDDRNSIAEPYWDWDKFYESLSYFGLHRTTKGSEYYNNNQLDISKYSSDTEAGSTKASNCN
ncbi:hypothetical protein DSM03_1011219 [Leeuwenhoekiella aestuarii]|uniref:Uncharacterized protein n=1 Tax=Leeuwenhoekiella aestuarii TaxID=2249426 RepID=A0A4Q0P131_9FLAO|nr:hypothetical protein [Leeuwenhoekiella aestuarii]RXG18528.1 hypothetical protein DSM04_101730 [Leeuwenhoekiella aestuarii]RXG19833.1 hypothetical protein DSM03_1011219 [Leeuwenhoekiella aestuarii]